MNKKYFTLLIVLCLCLTLTTVNAESRKSIKVEETPSVSRAASTQDFYSTANSYNYNLDSLLAGSPDSFEAWIKLPEASVGGTIMGNFHERDYSYDTINWEVSSAGFFSFHWNDKAIQHTFTNTTYLADDEWHHVALVRTPADFKYYCDGVLQGTYSISSDECISTATFNIGVDKSNWRDTKTPLEGYVRQVTLYSGAISQAQIVADMKKDSITSSDRLNKEETTLLGNWYLGEKWKNRVVESTEPGTPTANIYTFEKYVGADYSFGAYDYTFIVLPDIQIMGNYNVPRLTNMVKWILQKKDEMNIKFVLQVGDLSDFGQRPELYKVAADNLDLLNNKVPYCFVPGNHDYDDNAGTRNQQNFKTYFPVSKHSKLPGFGGVFEADLMSNNYYKFEFDDIKYLVINFEYHPRMSAIRWASRIIEAHPEHRVIIASHDVVNPDGSLVNKVSAGYEATGSQKFVGELSKYPNVFMAFGGHHPYDDLVYRIDKGPNGNKVMSMLVDGQGAKYKGDGAQDMILLVHVNETNKTMNFVYYSPEKGKVWNLQNQFQINFADPNNPAIGE